MKNILISSILGLSLFACASHKEETPAVVSAPVWDPAPPTPNTPQVSSSSVISGDTWRFTVPGNWQKINIDNEPTIKAVYGNPDIKGLVILEQEKFDGKIDDYAQLTASAIVHQGGNLVGSQQTSINNINYYVIIGIKNEATLTLWSTVIDGYAYNLTCGGPTSSAVVAESCRSIANSFSILKQ